MSQKEVFSEQEAAQILRRAAELMEKTSIEGAGYTPGITREELEHIAREVGVDPKYLLLAISEKTEIETERGGFRFTEEFERVIEGELDPANFDVLAEQIKPFGNAGQPAMAQIGRSFQASAWTGIGQAKVTVNSRNGRTRLSVKSSPLFALLAGGYPALMGALISAGSLSEAGHMGLGFAIAAGFIAVGTGAVNILLRKGHEKARQLADRLKERIAEETAEIASAEARRELADSPPSDAYLAESEEKLEGRS